MMFSIIIPVYNRETTIGDSVNSVLVQSYAEWELLLVDDGSSDRTGEICRAYANGDARVRYIPKENGGVSSARNVGLHTAKGEYILFLDSDDAFSPQALEVLAEHIAAYPRADLFCFGFGTWLPQDSEGKTVLFKEDIRARYLPTHINIYPQTQNFLENFVWNKCFKAAFLRDHDLYFDEDRRNQEDGIFVVNCLDQASTILLIPQAFRSACANGEIEHLSAKLYKEQLSLYVGDETAFRERFAGEYDFASAHYCRSNFNVLGTLCSRMVNTYGKEAKPLIEQVMKEEIVAFWAANVTPANDFEKTLCGYIQRGETERIFSLYHAGLIRRFARKLRRMVGR